MYLLGLRALGHEVLYIEDTGECIYDPEQNARARSVLRHALHPRRARAVRARRSLGFVNYDGATTGSRASGAGVLRRRRSVHQPLRRFVVLARRVRERFRARCSSTPTRCSRSSPSPRARGGTSTSSAASIACSPLAPTSARRRRRPDRRVHLAQDLAAGRDRSLADRAPPRRSLHHGDDLEDRELHATSTATRTANSSSSSTCRQRTPPAVRAGRQRPAAAAAGARLGHVDAMGVSRSLWDYRAFIQSSRAEFGVAKHAYVSTVPAGSATGRSAISPRGGRHWCRTRAGARICQRARDCCGSPTAKRRSRASIESPPTGRSTRNGPTEIAREHFDARAVLPRFLEIACA